MDSVGPRSGRSEEEELGILESTVHWSQGRQVSASQWPQCQQSWSHTYLTSANPGRLRDGDMVSPGLPQPHPGVSSGLLLKDSQVLSCCPEPTPRLGSRVLAPWGGCTKEKLEGKKQDLERDLGEQATCLTGGVLLRSENAAGRESQAAESSEDVLHVSDWLPMCPQGEPCLSPPLTPQGESLLTSCSCILQLR